MGDVLAVLDEGGVRRAHFWGYSMGGPWIPWPAAIPDRLLSLISGGANPTWDMGDPADIPIYQWLQGGHGGFLEAWERETGPFPKGARERWLALDADALIAAMRGEDGPEDVIRALPGMQTPALLYAGTEVLSDEVEQAATMMPDATFIALEGLDQSRKRSGAMT